VVALFLSGGTWGLPDALPRVNALGYRLGSQFFFVTDWLVISLVSAIAFLRWREPPAAAVDDPSPWMVKAVLAPPRARVSVAVALVFLGLLAGTAGLFAAGTTVVAYRMVKRSLGEPRLFPDVSGAVQWVRSNADRWQSKRDLRVASDYRDAAVVTNSNAESPYLILTGATGDFIWNMPGQARSQAMVFFQQRLRPFDMYPGRLFVEFPRHLKGREWKRRQGVWVLQRFPDALPPSNVAYYRNEAAVRGFVPLDETGARFAPERATWFPLTLYASQLLASGCLRLDPASHGFAPTSGAERFPRRMWLEPVADATADAVSSVTLDLSRVLGPARLDYGYSYELKPPHLPRTVTMSVFADDRLLEADTLQVSSPNTPVQRKSYDLGPYAARTARVIFQGLEPKERVWLEELTLSMSDLDLPRR
jgi:hypothetical protein